MDISAVIPTYNEEENIVKTVARAREECFEVIVTDGGSRDRTVELARDLASHVLTGPPGRGGQLARGAARAGGEILLFLHADTRLPPGFGALIREALARPGACFGAFALSIAPESRATDIIAFGANLRTRLFALPYGDQAVFTFRRSYDRAGGFAPIPIMEDVDLALRLRKLGKFSPARGRAETSARRWQKEGALRATLRNYRLLTLFLSGVPAEKLAPFYRKK